ncbi:hypothetical protein HG263_21720 [Pseudoalteromonas sp. JBTF-M23]|uniref:Uncharacterized protein n=1 Tax=Pseudoalteromonas caenipelagi TaxID=2726988 RepID=A0A849VL22_9GAMM|nr:hypothetical protein [Pseudoalteromonas caenipelagi]NOU53123.1 hypothetical protein [Pseudoalteromonas caenipelagi]
MDLSTLFLVVMIGIVMRLYSLVLNLKDLGNAEAQVSQQNIRLVNPSNVHSISSARKEAPLQEGCIMLARSETLEKFFEHATEEQIEKYELQFRIERRALLRRLQALGYLDLHKERDKYFKELNVKR